MPHVRSFAFIVVVFSLVAGCNSESGSGGGKLRVAFVSNNPHEFWTFAERGCEKAAKEFDCEVLFRRPPQGSPAEQQQIVEKLLLMDVKGIAVSPCDAANQAVFFNTKVAPKVPLITQDSDLPPGSKRRCYLGTDNYGAGKAAGELVKQVLPDGGQIVVLVGSLDAQNAQERRQGVLDALAGEKNAKGPQLGKYELLNTITDDTQQAICKAKVDDFLVKHSGDKSKLCFVGLWAYNPPAALEAVKSAKLEGTVKIVGFDEHDQTLAGIHDGFVAGTVVQNPYEFGREAVRILVGLAKGDEKVLPEGGVKFIPFRVITKSNVDAFREEVKTLLAPPAA
jgi:ribose transport system substrate-binding protein